jgi:hypothetical protein
VSAVLQSLSLPEISGYDSNDDVDTKLHGDDAVYMGYVTSLMEELTVFLRYKSNADILFKLSVAECKIHAAM